MQQPTYLRPVLVSLKTGSTSLNQSEFTFPASPEPFFFLPTFFPFFFFLGWRQLQPNSLLMSFLFVDLSSILLESFYLFLWNYALQRLSPFLLRRTQACPTLRLFSALFFSSVTMKLFTGFTNILQKSLVFSEVQFLLSICNFFYCKILVCLLLFDKVEISSECVFFLILQHFEILTSIYINSQAVTLSD